MGTPRDLASESWTLVKELVLFKASLEDYVILGAVKLGAFAVGLGVGWYLWGAV
tara:strand:+ start:699 stop:860 length:162 start_codon:yes stop_codon:yes gene_type:complete